MRSRIRKNLKIKYSEILGFLMYFWIFNIDRFQSPAFTLFKYIILLITIPYILVNIKCLKGNIKELLLIFALGGCIVCSSFANDIESFNKRWSIFYALMLYVLFMMYMILGKRGMTSSLIKSGIIYLIGVLLLNDFLAIINPSEYYGIYETSRGWVIGTFMVGNKFNVAYDHFLLAVLIAMDEKKEKMRRLKVIFGGIFSAAVCIWVQCRTMTVGCIFFILLYFAPSAARKLMLRPTIVALATFISASFVASFSFFLSLPIVQSIVTNVLHRDLTLTGRTEVYAMIFRILSINPLLGNGYGNTVFATISIWYANAQNGFWNYCINYGIIAASIFVLLIIYSSSKVCSLPEKQQSDFLWIVMSVVYTFLLVGMVEISFGTQFLYILAMIFAFCNQIPKINSK